MFLWLSYMLMKVLVIVHKLQYGSHVHALIDHIFIHYDLRV